MLIELQEDDELNAYLSYKNNEELLQLELRKRVEKIKNGEVNFTSQEQ